MIGSSLWVALIDVLGCLARARICGTVFITTAAGWLFIYLSRVSPSFCHSLFGSALCGSAGPIYATLVLAFRLKRHHIHERQHAHLWHRQPRSVRHTLVVHSDADSSLERVHAAFVNLHAAC